MPARTVRTTHRLNDTAPGPASVKFKTVAQHRQVFEDVVATDSRFLVRSSSSLSCVRVSKLRGLVSSRARVCARHDEPGVNLGSRLAGGDYTMGSGEHTLSLPRGPNSTTDTYMRPDVTWDQDAGHRLGDGRFRSHPRWDVHYEPTGIRDNVATPSHLVFETRSHANNTVDGVLTWNVTRGWEGYAYRLCVTARHVPAEIAGGHAEASDVRTRMAGVQERLGVAKALVASRLFSTRCMLIVVPKCLRCYSASDTLDAIAGTYGAAWLDLWTVNPQVSLHPHPCHDDDGATSPLLLCASLHRRQRAASAARRQEPR